MIDYFVSLGVDTEVVDNNGQTPLIRAAEAGRSKAVRALLKANANVDARDNLSMTALMHAVLQGKVMMTKDLLAHGADVDATTTVPVYIASGYYIDKYTPREKVDEGATALMFAERFEIPNKDLILRVLKNDDLCLLDCFLDL